MTYRWKMDMFRSAIIAIAFCLSLLPSLAGDILLRHSSSEPRIKELSVGVSERVADQSLAVARNIIGTWTALPTISKTLSPNPEVTWQSIRFDTNGHVEISYKLSSKGDIQQFIGAYEVIHKATVGKGNPPNIVIRPTGASAKMLNVLVNVRIGEFSYFPPDVPVLWFQDLDGYNYAFEPVGVSPEQRLKLLGRGSAETPDVARKKSGNYAQETARLANPDLTRQICAKLGKADLSDPERNKEILRLMNEGDETCVPVLLGHLNAKHSLVVRQNTIRALGKVGDKRAVPPLLDILRAPVQGNLDDEAEDEAILRRNAVVALGEIGDPAALPVLKTVADSAQDYQSVRDLARITANKLEAR